MADLYVTNSLGNLTVKFNITLRYFIVKNENGEFCWTLEIGSTHPDVNGNPIGAKKIHDIATENLDEVIETTLADLCALILWDPLVLDKEPPFVYNFSPSGNDVPITSNVEITIKDKLPSAGIDLSNMKVILNNGTQDFDITSEIKVIDAYYNEYKFRWVTPLRVYDTYD